MKNHKPKTNSNKLKWINRHVIHDKRTIDLVGCPLCKEEFSFDYETGIGMDNYSYCPNCGTKLKR